MLPLDEKIELFYEYQEKYSAKVLCEVLGISRGTYSNRIVNQKDPVFWSEHRAEIEKRVIEIFDKSQQRFGADKILATLQKEGMHTSKQMVRSIMKQHGIQSIGVNAKKDYLKEVKEKRNVIKRKFDIDVPNKVWLGDITQFWWNDEKYYVFAVLDLFSRKMVGHRVSKSSSTRLVTSTLRDAFEQRGKPQGLTFHSDRVRIYLLLARMSISISVSGGMHATAVGNGFMRRTAFPHATIA